MKIAVFSDSHGDVDTMYAAVEAERPDAVIHLGDHISDGIELKWIFPDLPIYIVAGNTDTPGHYDEELAVKLGGILFFIAHGHRYGVKSGTADIMKKGADVGAGIVLFGHTHKPFLSFVNGLWLMNPGRAGLRSPRSRVLEHEDVSADCSSGDRAGLRSPRSRVLEHEDASADCSSGDRAGTRSRFEHGDTRATYGVIQIGGNGINLSITET